MFDLESEIRAWREKAGKQRTYSVEQLDELESHLRDTFDAERSSGAPEPDAWTSAMQQLGNLNAVATEFTKTGAQWLPARITYVALILVAALMCAVAGEKLRRGDSGLLLTAHVAIYSLGVAALIINGILAMYAVVVLWARGLSPLQAYGLRTATGRLSSFAGVAIAVGFALGAVWASQHLGSWFTFRDKEILALGALAWCGLVWMTARDAAAPSARLLTASLIASLLIYVCWLGPILRWEAYTFQPRPIAIILGVLTMAHFLAIHFAHCRASAVATTT